MTQCTIDDPVQNTVADVLKRTDWTLLSRQKLTLLEGMSRYQRLHLDGLLNWIDAIQNAAEQEGYPVVWLWSDEEEPLA